MTSPRSETPKRILLCRTDRLGDVVLALPCALLLKKMFPDCRLSFLVQPYTAPAVHMLPAVDDVIEMGFNENSAAIAATLRTHQFDAAVALYPEYRVARALKEAGIPVRAGIFYRWYSLLFTHRHREHRKHNLKHEAEYNLSLTYATFAQEGRWEDWLAPGDIFPLPLEIPAKADQRIADILGRFKGAHRRIVVLHPGGSGSAHRWPIERFCELVRRFKEISDSGIIITGNAGESFLCQAVAQAAGGAGISLCGQISLPELAAMLRHCQLLITNSTGPLHLGRAVGAKVLGLFPSVQAMSPKRWGPYGLPQNALTASAGKSMESIAVASVLKRASELLE